MMAVKREEVVEVAARAVEREEVVGRRWTAVVEAVVEVAVEAVVEVVGEVERKRLLVLELYVWHWQQRLPRLHRVSWVFAAEVVCSG